jgi:hypothetical protein
MAKRNQQPAKPTTTGPADSSLSTNAALAAHHAHPPAKNPTLLGVSIILFALWIAFLLATALLG